MKMKIKTVLLAIPLMLFSLPLLAQDFYASFGLGRDDKGISTLDTSGIALAGIQALVDENRALQARIEQLEQLVSRILGED